MRVKLPLLTAIFLLAVAAKLLPANASSATPVLNPAALNPALQKCVRDNTDQDAAIADCTAAIVSGKLNRIEMFNAYAARASAYLAKKNFDAMLADATAIVSIAPNNREGFLLRGIAYEYLGKAGTGHCGILESHRNRQEIPGSIYVARRSLRRCRKKFRGQERF